MVGTIPRLSPEWSMKFVFKVPSLPDDNRYATIVHLSIGGSIAQRGDRTPVVQLLGREGKMSLIVASTINDHLNFIYSSKDDIVLNVSQPYSLEVHQRYLKNGLYRFFVILDHVEIFSVVNRRAEQFYGVKVWACAPWSNPSLAEISNFEHTNFL